MLSQPKSLRSFALKIYLKYQRKRWISKNTPRRPPTASSTVNKAFFNRLLEFPSEILSQILEDLQDDLLFCISGLCRRFNEVALRIYFDRRSIPAGDIASGELVLGSSESLSGFRRAFFVNSIRSLTCGFRDWYVMEDLWELEWLLKRTQVTRDLSLNFRQSIFQVADNDPIASFTTHDLLNSLRKVIRALTKRRAAIVVLTGNKLGGVFTCSPEDVLRWDLERRNFTRKRTRFEQFSNRVKAGLRLEPRTPYETLLRMYFEPPETNSSIKYLEEVQIRHLDSPRSWSLITFNTSSIDHLALTVNLSPEIWGTILPSVHLPALRYFEVNSSSGFFASDVEAFASRHKTVSFVVLKAIVIAPNTPPITPEIFPSISWLASTPAYLARVLGSTDAFPHLTDIWIVPSMVYEGPHIDTSSAVDPFNEIFRSLARRHNELHVGFDPFSVPSIDELVQCLTTRPAAGVDEEAQGLQSVISIAISEYRKEAVDYLPRWLSFFPALLDINFSDKFMASFGRDRELVQYINLVHQACPYAKINPDGVR
ncbi:hypothetical protein PLEOSDRAFT_1103601 [Pleurotus ostreatus PC15]|uniref:F-box domain-containing protein n=2 Tax=Pleurotus TaxID=5320 RepID=A0A067NRF5_PLEO1|nr:hypothetical protein CCMSSC00406_0001122 [Pleurotus cornucopiae]KDQ29590.1 hypothetical protein PLEOSDRAFT_1103601 [Pleurotus ostreatus PC15]